MSSTATVRGLILSFTVATAAGAAPKITDLFVPSSRYPCFRQPGLIRAGSVLLAFAENRNVSSCAPASGAFQPGENEVGSLQLRRSADGGTSWTDMQEIHVGNIDFYTGVFDANNNRTFLMLQSQDSVLVFESGDMGTTWSKPKSLSGVTPPPPFSKTLKPTVGHGIQIDRSLCSGGECDSAGRLVLPFICTNASAAPGKDKGACPGCHACIIVSDDDGASWALGGIGQPGSRESQAVQLRNEQNTSAILYINERNFGPFPGHRMVETSSNGGLSLGSPRIDPSLRTPVTEHWTGIVGSATRLEARGRDWVAFASASDPTERAKLRVYASGDGGKSWEGCDKGAGDGCGRLLWAGPAGYIDMVQIKSDAAGSTAVMGAIFECGNVTFADRVSFARFDSDWLLDGNVHV